VRRFRSAHSSATHARRSERYAEDSRYTVAAYFDLVKQGLLDEDDRVELAALPDVSVAVDDLLPVFGARAED